MMDSTLGRQQRPVETKQTVTEVTLITRTFENLLCLIMYMKNIEHPEHLMEKLNNYKLGIIKEKNPMDLDRAEDYYVELTNADISLNRYKATNK